MGVGMIDIEQVDRALTAEEAGRLLAGGITDPMEELILRLLIGLRHVQGARCLLAAAEMVEAHYGDVNAAVVPASVAGQSVQDTLRTARNDAEGQRRKHLQE
jgi:hypothetical protein